MPRQHADDQICEEVRSQKDSKNPNIRINDTFTDADGWISENSFWNSFNRELNLQQYI
jgi:hypothetical protein